MAMSMAVSGSGSPSASDKVILKATYGERSIQDEMLGQENIIWQTFKTKLQSSFGLRSIDVKYTNSSDVQVTIDNQDDFEKAMKVGRELGTLHLTVTEKPYNDYVEKLHLKLSSEPMDAKVSSPESSFVEINHSDIGTKPSVQVKYHPYCHDNRSSTQYYSGKATPSVSNKYVERIHTKLTKLTKKSKVPLTATCNGRSIQMDIDDVAQECFTWQALKSRIKTAFQLSNIVVKYTDDAGDSISVDSQEEFKEAMKVGRELGALKLTVTGQPYNEYVEDLHMKLSLPQKLSLPHPSPPMFHMKPHSDIMMLPRSPATILIASNEYVEALHNKLVSMSSHCCARTPTACELSDVIHSSVICDGCDNVIKGPRFKCGNCSNYDLCGSCEPMSGIIHHMDHVFIKINIPTQTAGFNRKGVARPLLKRNLYQRSLDDISDEEVHERRCGHLKRQHHDKTCDTVLVGGAYVTRPKDRKREEIKAAKLRKKEERRKMKMEHKVEKLGSKLAATSVYDKQHPHKHKGHGKYLDCQFITDTSCPDNTLVPYQVPFEKGWLIMNSGTKKWKHVQLIHTDGFKPLHSTIDVPELKPGERVELVAKYPAITDNTVTSVKSSWRLVHRETTPFGPLLWLQVLVAKPHLPPCPPPQQPLTNENLLKSIGFIPSDETSSSDLLKTFEVVDAPPTVNDHPQADDDGNMSVASDDSDFVVVIPDCFNLDKPLPGFPSSSEDGDNHVTVSNGEELAPKSDVKTDDDPVGGVSSKDTCKVNFVPERLTLKQVKERKLYRNPIVMATGLVNTVSDMVDQHVHFKKTPPTNFSSDNSSSSDSDDKYEDAPEMLCPPDLPPTGGHKWMSSKSDDVSKWIKTEDSEDMSRYCHNPDVSGLLPLHWDGPKNPSTPMERLIQMGFADRQLNADLLTKHNNDLSLVLNELLDHHRQSFGKTPRSSNEAFV